MNWRNSLRNGNFSSDLKSVMHMGVGNNEEDYIMTNHADGTESTLLKTSEEKDLGVWFDNTGKPSNHAVHAVNKANQLLGLIKRTFTYMDCSLMRHLFTSVVRPHEGAPKFLAKIFFGQGVLN